MFVTKCVAGCTSLAYADDAHMRLLHCIQECEDSSPFLLKCHTIFRHLQRIAYGNCERIFSAPSSVHIRTTPSRCTLYALKFSRTWQSAKTWRELHIAHKNTGTGYRCPSIKKNDCQERSFNINQPSHIERFSLRWIPIFFSFNPAKGTLTNLTSGFNRNRIEIRRQYFHSFFSESTN